MQLLQTLTLQVQGRKGVGRADWEGEGTPCRQQRASMVSETGDKGLMMSWDPTGGTENGLEDLHPVSYSTSRYHVPVL